jgi:hypothetical protein
MTYTLVVFLIAIQGLTISSLMGRLRLTQNNTQLLFIAMFIDFSFGTSLCVFMEHRVAY